MIPDVRPMCYNGGTENAPASVNSGGATTEVEAPLPPKNTTLRVFPPKPLRPCGHISTRILKNGETAYLVTVSLERKRHPKRVVRSAHTLEEAQALLELSLIHI